MAFAEGALAAGRFQLLRRLGAGGLAEVWAARDTVTGAEVALKALHEHLLFDRGLVERFRRELAVTRGLDHPGIVRVFDLHEDAGRPFFAMELLRGETVAERLRRGPLPPAEAKRIAAEICRALACAHRAGVVHRDLKPQNVFLAEAAGPGGPPRVKLLDFGLARAAGLARLTAQSTVMGTPGYVAPELLSGEGADARSDLYALGATLFEMLAGRRAFPYADPYEVLRKQQAPAPSVREAGARVGGADDALVRRALDPDPEKRFADAGQLEQALSGRAQLPAIPVPPAMAAGKSELVVHRNRDRDWKDELQDLESLVDALGGVPVEPARGFLGVTLRFGSPARRRLKRWLGRVSTWGQAPLVSGCSLETGRRLATFCQERGIAASVRDRRPPRVWTRLRAGLVAAVTVGASTLLQAVQFLLPRKSSGFAEGWFFALGILALALVGWHVIRSGLAPAIFSELPEGDPSVRRLMEGIRRRATRLRDQVTAAPEAARMLTDDLLRAAQDLAAQAERLGDRAALLADPLTPLPGARPAGDAETGRDRDRLISHLLEIAAAIDEAIAATALRPSEEPGAALARLREEAAFARRVLPEASAAGDLAPPAREALPIALAEAPSPITPVAPPRGPREQG